MRSRLATAVTIVGLLAGTGGAIALGEGSSAGGQGGAATAQYKPGKGCGKKHSHTGKKCPVPKRHRKAKKPKKAHRPSAKKPRSSNCKIQVLGQTLIAYCPNP